jgi:hypothetical protein
MLKKSFLIAGVVALVGFSAEGQAAKSYLGKSYKEIKHTQHLGKKQTKKILLDAKGGLWRVTEEGKQPCQMTANVSEIKMAQHPRDVAMVYYVQNGDLKYGRDSSRCNSANRITLVRDVKEYNTVGSVHSTIVNVSLSESGEFTAWGVDRPLYRKSSIRDYSMNKNYPQKGKPFSSNVVFLESTRTNVVKVKGGRVKENGSREAVSDSIDPQHRSLVNFLRANNLK